MGKGKVIAGVGITVGVLVLLLSYLDEKSRRLVVEDELEKKDKQLKRKQDDYLKLLAEFLESKKDIPEIIKTQLEHLAEEYDGLNEQVAEKLHVVQELLEDGKPEIAIEKLGSIVENLLKEKFIAEGKAKDRRSCPRLFKLLEKAKEFKWITKQEFHISNFLRELRNQEAHELDAKVSENEAFIAFLSGIQIIYKLQGIKAKANTA